MKNANKTKPRVPVLRFPEFMGTGEWEEKKMRNVGTIVASGDLDKKSFSNHASATYPYPVYSNAITKEGLYGYYSIYKYSADSITITARGTLGFAFLRTNKFMGIGRLIVISVNKKEYYPYFLKECWNHLVEIAVETTSIPQLTAVSVKTIELPFPPLPEQKKIAKCLTALDEHIALQIEELNALKAHKKGLLQKLFPAAGATVPELRFAEFVGAGDWEEKIVSDVCSVSTGKSNTQDKIDNGKYPFYVRSAIVERSRTYLYDEEAVLTIGDGVGTGKVYHYVYGKYNLHQRCYRLFKFKDIQGKFLFYLFSTQFAPRVSRMTAKNSVDSVRMNMITEMPICVPSIKEQQKIAECLTALDDFITAQTEKIDLLKEHKKGLLQQLFPQIDA